MRRITMALGALALGLTFLPATPAGAGLPPAGLDIEPLFVLAQPTFSFTLNGNPCTSGTTVTVADVSGEVIDLDGFNEGTITLPVGTPGGGYDVHVTCTTAQGPGQFDGSVEFGTIIVTKVVEGDAPAGTEFDIAVDCGGGELQAAADGDPQVEATVTFGADGGTQGLVHYTGQTCTITETEDGGALESSLETQDCGGEIEVPSAAAVGPTGEFSVNEPTDCTQTVTNTFADAPPTTTPPPAARPVTVAPRFTG